MKHTYITRNQRRLRDCVKTDVLKEEEAMA